MTVARSSIGVSDGLRFRSRLASWQNVAYSDNDLGHAVLPSAPVGRIHGVTRTPSTPRNRPAEAPLVLRAADAPLAPLAPLAGEGEAPPRPAAPRRVVPAVPGSASRPSGAGTPPAPPQASPAPVRARRTAPSLIVARRPSTTPRTLSTLASTAVPAPDAGTPPVRRGLGDPLGALPPGADAEVRRPSAGGPELPVVQRRADASATPGRPGPDEPSAEPRSAPGLPVVQRQADVSAPTGPAAGSPVRPTLDGQPPVAVPGGPVLPAVQRQAEEPAAPGAPDLPVVHRQADVPVSSGPAAGSSARPTPDGQPPVTAPGGPVIQRRADAPASTGSAAGSPVRPTLDGQPPVTAPGGSALPVVQREAEESAASEQPVSGAPALPVVQRQSDVSASTGPGAGSPVRPTLDGQPPVTAPGGSALPVVQREAEEPAAPEPPVRGAPALPVVQRQADASSGAAAGGSVPPASGGRSSLAVPAGTTGAQAGPALPVVQREADAPASTPQSVRPTLGGQSASAGDTGARAGAGLPVVQRQADDSADPGRPAPGVPAGPGLPVVQRLAGDSAAAPEGPAGPSVVRRSSASPAPVRGTRPTLGKPLRELPADAAPFAPSTARDAGGPGALPVVQRQTSDGAATPPTGPGSQARTRGGLGAPLAALPPTAGTADDGPHRAQPAAPQSGPAAPSAMPLRATPPAHRATADDGPPRAQPAAPRPGPAAPSAHRAAGTAPVRVQRVPSRHGPGPAPVQRARALLAARTLTVRTGAADGFTAPESAAATRPVVPATWRRDTPRPEAAAQPVVQRVAADPVAAPRPHAPLPAARSAAPQEPAVPAALAPESAHRAPVVRPHPPGTPRPGGSAAPVQRLAMPVVAETGAPAPGPEPEAGAPAGVPQPLAVRPSAPRTGQSPPTQGNTQADTQAVQRAVAQAGLAGVPVTVVQRQPARGPAPERPAEPAPDVDVEDLARRLIDPVARLLRADLRRGRERSGRPYDGRR
ncbi:hypothetical protein ACFUJY_11740 [Streptomyces sp. NPDC057249]|uniref:hypothetical protein n=1 Tax=Streptomyces sp. NPDC057249 TaxID=3346067 RepID=UPI0036448FA8